MTQPEVETTAWGPLRNARFRSLWLVWLFANLCAWMSDVAAAWMMTSLSTSPMLVALVQTAATLPSFLLAVPSGALADLVDHRHWYIGTMLWLAAIAVALTVCAGTGILSAPLLLVLVFANGTGMALRWPVHAAVLHGAVSLSELPQALALNSIAVNGSRVLGPLLAGALLAVWGGTSVFAVSAVLSLAAAALLWSGHHASATRAKRSEPFIAAVRLGLQTVLRSATLRIVMIQGFLVFMQIGALLALLPLAAKRIGDGGASTYSLLLACVGSGAVAMAFLIPWLRRRTGTHGAVALGTALLACGTAGLAVAGSVWLAGFAMIMAGTGWLSGGNSLNVSAQLALPDAVRARGMSIFLMAAMAGSAAGAAFFGAVADHLGLRAALLLAAAVPLALLWAMRGSRMDDRSPAR